MVFIFFADIKEKSSKVFYNPPPIKLYRIYRKIPKGVPLCTLKETITCECEVPGSTRAPFPTHGGGGGGQEQQPGTLCHSSAGVQRKWLKLRHFRGSSSGMHSDPPTHPVWAPQPLTCDALIAECVCLCTSLTTLWWLE